jgi:subtilisin family serine protease
MDAKEYIVILNSHTDLDDFYTDMEQQSRYEYIPNRPVEMVYRRPMSCSTHYLLTDEEVAMLQQDPRVLSVEEPYYNRGLKVMPMNQYSTNWNKSGIDAQTSLNWGLLRGYEGTARAGWGSNGTSAATGTVKLTNVGNNVDVVIIDGHMLPGHPEFAVNADGTGGSRVNQFNWFQYNSQVRGVAAGTYVYDFGSSAVAVDDNNHGAHVAGIAAGNTCGWARGANIYNISPYDTTINATGYSNYSYDIMDYIRVFHANKPINSRTGCKNPTVVNMSYGFFGEKPIANITRFRYKGVITSKPTGGWTKAQLDNFGLIFRPQKNAAGQYINLDNGPNVFYSGQSSSIDQNVEAAIADGIIFVGAAGNYYAYNASFAPDTNTTDMFNNYFVIPEFGINFAYYYHRGASPTRATGVIHVSAIDSTVLERKVNFSNAGTRTDIFAAGSNIMSSHNTPGVADPRNSSYYKTNLSGTSMASPQVTGIIACALETYPNMTPAQALTYVRTYANSGVLADPTINTDFSANQLKNVNTLLNGPNLFMTYRPERGDQYQVYPTRDYSYRPASGRVYPRPRIRRFG